jgi:hypothetical protein
MGTGHRPLVYPSIWPKLGTVEDVHGCFGMRAVGTFMLYILGTAVPIVVGAAGLQMIMSYGVQSSSADSVLAQRIQTTREIRAALAKPIPPPPPLEPITAKLAHPIETRTATRSTKPKRIPQEAWDAFAQGQAPAQGQSSYSYPRQAYGGSGGW